MTYGSRGRPLAVGPAEEQDSFARACQKRWQRFEVTMFEPNPVSEMAILETRGGILKVCGFAVAV